MVPFEIDYIHEEEYSIIQYYLGNTNQIVREFWEIVYSNLGHL